ncbi:5-oxoprolinase-like isoform X2 [Clavelina lepadiformis]
MSALMCQPSTVKNLDFVAAKFGDFLQTFQARYKRGFRFANPGCDIINDGGRVGGIGLSGVEDHALLSCLGHKSKCMSCDHMIHGPLIVIDKNSTILVEPDCKAEMTKKC